MASCTMPIKDVGELVNALENAGELKRISAQVDPDLEIAEILRRTMYAKGPAILFENVKGYDMPVLGNAFGSEKMLQIGLEMEDFTEIGSRIVDMTRMDIPSSTLGKLKKLPELSKMGGAFPKLAPAQTKPKGTMPKGFTPESASKPKPLATLLLIIS